MTFQRTRGKERGKISSTLATRPLSPPLRRPYSCGGLNRSFLLIDLMDSMTQPASNLRFLNLAKSFKLAIHPLLTACPREDFDSAFSVLDHGERQTLHKLIMQVIASLHESMQEEFESICHETQVHTAFELVEQLVEEQSLDILHADKTNLVQVREQLMKTKLDEIHCLRTMLAKADEKSCALRSHLESLKQGIANVSVAATLVEKLKSSNQQYGQIAEQALP